MAPWLLTRREGRGVGRGDAHAPTACIIQKKEKVLPGADASPKDVVATRMCVSDISIFNAYAVHMPNYFAASIHVPLSWKYRRR